jgi:hypothetical protein
VLGLPAVYPSGNPSHNAKRPAVSGPCVTGSRARPWAAGEIGCRLLLVEPNRLILVMIVMVMVMVMMVGVHNHNHLSLRSNRYNCEAASKNQSEQNFFHALVSQPALFRAVLL